MAAGAAGAVTVIAWLAAFGSFCEMTTVLVGAIFFPALAWFVIGECARRGIRFMGSGAVVSSMQLGVIAALIICVFGLLIPGAIQQHIPEPLAKGAARLLSACADGIGFWVAVTLSVCLFLSSLLLSHSGRAEGLPCSLKRTVLTGCVLGASLLAFVGMMVPKTPGTAAVVLVWMGSLVGMAVWLFRVVRKQRGSSLGKAELAGSRSSEGDPFAIVNWVVPEDPLTLLAARLWASILSGAVPVLLLLIASSLLFRILGR